MHQRYSAEEEAGVDDTLVVNEQTRVWFEPLLRQLDELRDLDIDEQRRRLFGAGGEQPAAREEVALVEAVDAGGVPARLYRPGGDEQNVLVWFHGGGWWGGDL